MRIVEALKWTDVEETQKVASQLFNNHIMFISNQLNHKLRRFPSTLNNLYDLNDEILVDLISSPQVCRIIYESESQLDEKGLNDRLIKFILIELERFDSFTTGIHWSASSNFKIKDGKKSKSILHKGIVLDFDFSFEEETPLNSNFRPKFSKSIKYNGREKQSVNNKFRHAIEKLSIHNHIFDFIIKNVKSIVPRKDLLTKTFKGSSNRSYIRRMNSFNPHQHNVVPSVIATSIIHESIHIALYIIEQSNECINNYVIAHDSRIKSNWSGNQINALAFLHAIFVWYSIFQFWNNNKLSEGYSKEIKEYYLTFCKKGFENNYVYNSMKQFKNSIRPDLFSQIVDIQNIMNGY